MTLPGFSDDTLVPPVSSQPERGGQTQSLYRKYRPQTFDSDELVGQEHIVRTLRNAIQHGRVAHAYLFCGPRGTGKTTTARLLAKAVNCLHPELMRRPCNECSACLAIGTAATADVIEIDAASNRGIDDIRDLRERVKYAPTQLTSKFYIIDEAHQITGAAANAFLKTLEEPPPHTRFVLATTDPEELLPTIVSRCQRFDFRRIGLDAIVARLRRVAEAESFSVSDDALQAIARHATGSLRDALGLLDQLAVWGEEDGDQGTPEITADAVLELLGVSRNERVERLVKALADRDASLALGTVNDAVEAGEDPRQLNRQLVAYLRVLMHERAGGSPDADERARELAAQFDLATLGRMARIFSETDFKIRRSTYAQLPLEIALVDAIVNVGAPPLTVSPATRVAPESGPSSRSAEEISVPRAATPSLKDRVRAGAQGGHLQVVPPPSTSNHLPVERHQEVPPPATGRITALHPVSGELSIDQIADLWPRIRNDVKAVNRRIEALLASIDPVAVSGNQITLAAAYDFHRRRLNEDDVRQVVEDAISRITGRPVMIECVMRGEEPHFRPAPVTGNGTHAAEPPAVESTDSQADGVLLPDGPTEADLDRQRLQAAKNIFDGEEL